MKWALAIQKKEKDKQTNVKLNEQDKKREELYKQLGSLYQFVRWTDKGFRNRKERKAFWKSVSENTEIIKDTISNMINQYAKRDKKEYEAPQKKNS